jgi:hypothetical protein
MRTSSPSPEVTLTLTQSKNKLTMNKLTMTHLTLTLAFSPSASCTFALTSESKTSVQKSSCCARCLGCCMASAISRIPKTCYN